MAGSINKATLLGYLGRYPEVRYTQSGQPIATFSVATSESWNDKSTGEKKERTEWHNITVFGKLAEICGEYLNKGSRVYVEGKLQTDKWQDNDGNERRTTKIIVDIKGVVVFLGGGERSQGQQTQGGHGQPAQGGRPPQPPRHQTTQRKFDYGGQGQGPSYEEDDIPF